MKRRFVLLAMAFLVALASTGAVFTYVSQVDARAVADQQPTKVLVVTKPIPAGTRAADVVADGLAEVKTFARSSVPDGALADVDDISGEVALGDFYPGEMLLAAKFGEKAPPNSGALTIPDGKLAVSVLLEDPRGVARFVVPGLQVAVFDTFNVVDAGAGAPAPSGDRLTDKFEQNRATRLLLPRVEVLAVDAAAVAPAAQEGTNAEEQPAAQPSTTVTLTLAVNQQEAEKVIHAAETGSLWFALLSASSKTAPSAGIDNHRLFD